MNDPRCIRIGDWIVTPSLNLLQRGTESVNLEPRAMDVLIHLARHPGEVVPVDELIAAVWQGVAVSDHSVYLAISQIRRAIEEGDRGRRYIETIRKRGYRLAVPVVPLDAPGEPGSILDFVVGNDETAAAVPPAADGRTRPRRSLVSASWVAGAFAVAMVAGFAALIRFLDRPNATTPEAPPIVAVLPCENRSPDPKDAFFAAGIHDEIVQRLQQLSGVSPLSRNATLQYAERRPSTRQIAVDHGADAVMECAVRYAGESFLVTATLIDPDADTPLWSQSYDGDRSDVSRLFAVQADVAMNIATALNAQLLPAEQQRINRPRTVSMEAYQYFLRLRDEYPRRPPHELFGYADRAIEADPDFAFAYVARGVLHLGAADNSEILRAIAPDADSELFDSERQLELGLEDVHRGLEIDPDLGFAYTILGRLDMLDGDNDSARAKIERAVELSPGDPFTLRNAALFHLTQNRFPEALDLMDRTGRLDPGLAEPMVYAIAGEFDQAREIALGAQNSLNPQPHMVLGLLEATIFGNPETAEAELRLSEELAGNDLLFQVSTELLLVYAYGRLGLEGDARRVYDQVVSALPDEQGLTPMARMRAHLAFGEIDQAYQSAVEMVSNALPLRSAAPLIFSLNTFDDPVLERPEFLELRRRVGSMD